MRYIIKEQQLQNLAHRYILEKLNEMDFKKMKNKDFSFFPKGTNIAENGIEADWMKDDKGYSILVGEVLWSTIEDMFGLSYNEVQTAFIKAFIDKGIKKILDVDTVKLKHLMADYLAMNNPEE